MSRLRLGFRQWRYSFLYSLDTMCTHTTYDCTILSDEMLLLAARSARDRTLTGNL